MADVMLDVWVIDLLLRGNIFECVFVSRFGGAEESGGIVGNEARLPSLLHILAWVTDDVLIWNKGSRKMDQMAHRCSHSDRIPPRIVEPYGAIGKIACHQKLSVERRRAVPNSTWAFGGYQQDGPFSAAAAR